MCIMCGVVGYYSKRPSEKDRFTLFKLFKQSRIRGLHSFGLGWYDLGEMRVKKYSQSEFKKIEIPFSNFVIFHNRYSTSGDYKDPNNNQPILVEDTALVFNGVIDMGTREDMERRWSIEMSTENDGEIVLRKSGGDPKKMIDIVREAGSFSGLVLKDQRLYAMTNGKRPLWYLTQGESVFIASTRDIFIRALGDCDPKPLPINILHVWGTK